MRVTLRAAGAVGRGVLPLAGRRTVNLIRYGARRLGVAGRVEVAVVREARRRHRAGELGNGNAILVPLVECPPQAVSTALRAAGLLSAAGEPAAAARLCSALLARRRHSRPDRSQILAALAMAEQRGGKFDAAIEYLRTALAADPWQTSWRRTLARWYFDRGHRLAQAGQWESAAVAYQTAVSHDDRHPAWRRRLDEARERAPQWIFQAAGPGRACSPADFPGAQAVGLVVPPHRDAAVTGWIPDQAGGDRRVLFTLNGVVVAEAQAARQVTLPDGNRYWEFRRSLHQLWSSARAGDVLEVVHAGRPIPIINSGWQYLVTGANHRPGVCVPHHGFVTSGLRG